MTLSVPELAEKVDRAACDAQAIDQLSASDSFSLNTAYLVQQESIRRRQQRGESIVGAKMGFTSRAKMIQMGVDDLIWGRLTDKMWETDGGTVDLARFVHPRVEPEIAFLLGRSIGSSCKSSDIAMSVEAVAPAMEIIDSRYKNFKFSVEDVVADNSSSSGFVIGSWKTPEIDFSNLGIAMSVNGEAVQIGSSAAILGHPVRALAELHRLATDSGVTIEAGSVVLAGAATAAIPLTADSHVRAEVESLGFVEFVTSSPSES